MPVAQVRRSDIAVCGRRDVSLPRNVQKEAEEPASHLVPQGRSYALRSRLLRETRGRSVEKLSEQTLYKRSTLGESKSL